MALQDVPGHGEETRDSYETELAALGGEITGERPFATREGTELDAVRGDLTATVGLSHIDNETSRTIDLVRP